MGRPKTALLLDAQQREQLESLASSRSLPAGLVNRTEIILLSASGKTNSEIAQQLEMTSVSGLHDELRPGRPRSISDERVAH